MAFIGFLHLLSLVVWLGGMAFFSFLAAPSIFAVLGPEEAGRVVALIFTKYYWTGYICGPVAFVTAVLTAGTRFGGIKIVLLAVMLVAFFYAGLWLRPRVASLKQELKETTDVSIVADLKGRFDKNHRNAVRLNILVLACGVLVILMTAASFKP